MKEIADYCRYADVFYGNGEVDHFAEDGLASKWFYIKALCGNTIPHAVLPFGLMSVGPYSGGYPTGYGTHYPNSCAGIRKLGDEMTIRGFSHLHQSGTGAIQYYYNYAIVTPFYGTLDGITVLRPIKNESARPGCYATDFNDVSCRLTVSRTAALHAYSFRREGGRVAVDFSNDGLSRLFGGRFYALVRDASLELIPSGGVLFSGTMSGIRLHFCVLPRTAGVKAHLFKDTHELTETALSVSCSEKPFGAVFDFEGSEIELVVAVSTVDAETARRRAAALTAPFETVASHAYDQWNERLSAIEIDTDDETFRTKFYSNLYHSLIKPCDAEGESVLGVEGSTVTDFATFWDQYKTVFPLIFTLYPDMGRKIAEGIVNISRTLKRVSCSFGLSTILPCEEQAKMLGIFALCDAYYCGLTDESAIEECILRELDRDDFASFIENGLFERYTHIADAADACLCAADIVRDPALKQRLLGLAENWKNAYDADGLMSEKSPYYEGDRFNYSFRLLKNMDERIALAGGRERFVQLLDAFFGFGRESVKPVTAIDAYREVSETAARVHRFEGFNNESDMEAPYAYVAAGRHDRLCEIAREAVTVSFTTGKGALPGNNDSGGLSSCFLWNALGLFPASGSGLFYIGTPAVNGARLRLSSGKTLEIRAHRMQPGDYHVRSACFNGRILTDFKIAVRELMQGGTLEFIME